VDFDDSALSKLPLPDTHRTGFEIVDFSVYLEGVCRECRERGLKPSALKAAKKSKLKFSKAKF
jgi:hypothetical protein